jgi:hypothetical protein
LLAVHFKNDVTALQARFICNGTWRNFSNNHATVMFTV